MIYLIGALKNKRIPSIANEIQERTGYETFADWFAPGPEADDFLRDYSKERGRSYRLTLESFAARHIYHFDKTHIDRAKMGVLVYPAGKSAHLELGYMIGQGKKCFIFFNEVPERVDVMHQFVWLNGGDMCFSMEELVDKIRQCRFSTK